jgi:hypothetical protein
VDLAKLTRYLDLAGQRGAQTGGYVVTVTPAEVVEAEKALGVELASVAHRKERHPVDTLQQAREAVIAALVADGVPGAKVWDFDVVEHIETYVGDSAELPDGRTISVEQVPDWSER